MIWMLNIRITINKVISFLRFLVLLFIDCLSQLRFEGSGACLKRISDPITLMVLSVLSQPPLCVKDFARL